MISLVILVPVLHLTEANALLRDLGWAGENFTVALSTDSAEPITHRGLRATVDDVFCVALEQLLAQKLELPVSWTVDTRTDKDRFQHFSSVVMAAGLQPILQ